MTFIDEKIKEFKERRQELMAEVEIIDQTLKNLGSKQKELSFGEAVLKGAVKVGQVTSAIQQFKIRFKDKKAPQAILEYLKSDTRPQTTKSIVDALLSGGFVSQSKNFYTTLYVSLVRMEKEGKIKRNVDGFWLTN